MSDNQVGLVALYRVKLTIDLLKRSKMVSLYMHTNRLKGCSYRKIWSIFNKNIIIMRYNCDTVTFASNIYLGPFLSNHF